MMNRFDSAMQRLGRKHNEDYAPDGADWISVCRVGSSYEEELDIRSQPARYRHRSFFDTGPWKSGLAPDHPSMVG